MALRYLLASLKQRPKQAEPVKCKPTASPVDTKRKRGQA